MSQLALSEKIEFSLIRAAGQSKLCKSVIKWSRFYIYTFLISILIKVNLSTKKIKQIRLSTLIHRRMRVDTIKIPIYQTMEN